MSREIKVALLMAASLFMDVMDGTIVTTALPKMAQNFNVSAATISLLVSTYMIAVAVFIPLSGWIAQRLGNKRIWLLAVALFTVSSLGSALAPKFRCAINDARNSRNRWCHDDANGTFDCVGKDAS